MNDELHDDLGPVPDFFGLPSKASVAKDFHVVRVISAVMSIDAGSCLDGFSTAMICENAKSLPRPAITLPLKRKISSGGWI